MDREGLQDEANLLLLAAKFIRHQSSLRMDPGISRLGRKKCGPACMDGFAHS